MTSRPNDNRTSGGVILDPSIDQVARSIAERHARRELGFLVGSGTSLAVGLPGWTELLRRLVVLRTRAGAIAEVGGGTPKQFENALHKRFADAPVLANVLRVMAGKAFNEDLRSALYDSPESFGPAASGEGPQVAREPTPTMLHIAALAQQSHGVIHTLNFDDMLESAGRVLTGDVRSQTAEQPLVGGDLTVAHLHGHMPPRGKPEGIVLTERQFNELRGSPRSWAQRELHSLFETRHVLMLGIGVDDPDLRQVLDVVGESHQHFMVRVMPGSGGATSRIGNALETRLWKDRNTDFVTLRQWNELAAFLVAVRHYAYDRLGTPAWRVGHEHLIDVLGRSWDDVWAPDFRRLVAAQLQKALPDFRQLLGVKHSARLEVGIHVPGPDGFLDLPFRSDEAKVTAMRPGYRRLRATPAQPQAVAGVAYASGALVIGSRNGARWNFGFDGRMADEWDRTSRHDYDAVACAPIFDWPCGGVPLGVGYVRSSNPDTFDEIRSDNQGVRTLAETLIAGLLREVIHSLRGDT